MRDPRRASGVRQVDVLSRPARLDARARQQGFAAQRQRPPAASGLADPKRARSRRVGGHRQTNVTVAERAAIIRIARERQSRIIGYYIDASTREAVARNEKREGRARVPKVAIFTCAKRLAPPSLEEGFDELHRVRVDPEGRFVEVT